MGEAIQALPETERQVDKVQVLADSINVCLEHPRPEETLEEFQESVLTLTGWVISALQGE